jgi:hypothetical protein
MHPENVRGEPGVLGGCVREKAGQSGCLEEIEPRIRRRDPAADG